MVHIALLNPLVHMLKFLFKKALHCVWIRKSVCFQEEIDDTAS